MKLMVANQVQAVSIVTKLCHSHESYSYYIHTVYSYYIHHVFNSTLRRIKCQVSNSMLHFSIPKPFNGAQELSPFINEEKFQAERRTGFFVGDRLETRILTTAAVSGPNVSLVNMFMMIHHSIQFRVHSFQKRFNKRTTQKKQKRRWRKPKAAIGSGRTGLLRNEARHVMRILFG